MPVEQVRQNKMKGEEMQFIIKEVREKKNMSQDDLAKKSGVSRAIISNLETGKAGTTTTSTLEKLAAALGEPVSKIFLA